jgi:hypothetical protein
MEKRQFICGHWGAVVHMGRGQKRIERIKQYFNRCCHKCAIKHQKEYASELTLIDGTPYTIEQQQKYCENHSIKPY